MNECDHFQTVFNSCSVQSGFKKGGREAAGGVRQSIKSDEWTNWWDSGDEESQRVGDHMLELRAESWELQPNLWSQVKVSPHVRRKASDGSSRIHRNCCCGRRFFTGRLTLSSLLLRHRIKTQTGAAGEFGLRQTRFRLKLSDGITASRVNLASCVPSCFFFAGYK